MFFPKCQRSSFTPHTSPQTSQQLNLTSMSSPFPSIVVTDHSREARFLSNHICTARHSQTWLTSTPWRRRQYVHLKRWYSLTILHNNVSQKGVWGIYTVVKTSSYGHFNPWVSKPAACRLRYEAQDHIYKLHTCYIYIHIYYITQSQTTNYLH
jgi:hypothetical protein